LLHTAPNLPLTPLVCLKASKYDFSIEAFKYGFSVVPEILFSGKLLKRKHVSYVFMTLAEVKCFVMSYLVSHFEYTF